MNSREASVVYAICLALGVARLDLLTVGFAGTIRIQCQPGTVPGHRGLSADRLAFWHRHDATGVALRMVPGKLIPWSVGISLLATSLGFVGTARNLPVMRILWQTPDDDEPRAARFLDSWERWHIVGAVSHVGAFIALVVALAYV